jgi:hypothetical protein
MAILDFKWWSLPALSFGILFITSKSSELTSPVGKTVHPIHISTAEIVHNRTDNSLEITCKIFWDDFESILTKNNKNVKVDLTNEKSVAINNQLISTYISNHLNLVIDGKPVALSFVGFEKEDVVIYSYLEVANINTVNNISVTNSIMYDMFDDQVGIIHVIINGNRKSTKLDYPKTSASFIF